jgi:hypothetical protein
MEEPNTKISCTPAQLESESSRSPTKPETASQPLAEAAQTLASISEMPTNMGPIRCISCARILATVSPNGLVPTSDVDGCNTCQEFRPLHEAMQAANEEYASYRDRRDTFAPKIDAFSELKKTIVEFNNLLLAVEAVGDVQKVVPESAPRTEDTKTEGNAASRGTKRARSSSPASTAHSPALLHKGCLDTGIQPKRKRLKFSETVEFRDEYRPSNYYSRSDDLYARGRYAAPEDSEHLDTSGHSLTHLKFSGMRKVGSKWVDVWEEVNDLDKSKKKGKTKRTDAHVAKGEDESALWEVPDDGVSDPRAQRLARRKDGAPSDDASRKHIAVRSKNGRKGGSKVKASSQNVETARQPLGTSNGVMEDNSAVTAEPATTDVGEERAPDSTSCTPAEASQIKEDAPLMSGPGRDCLVSDGLGASSGHLAEGDDSEAPDQHDTLAQQLRAGTQDFYSNGDQEPLEEPQIIDGQHLDGSKEASAALNNYRRPTEGSTDLEQVLAMRQHLVPDKVNEEAPSADNEAVRSLSRESRSVENPHRDHAVSGNTLGLDVDHQTLEDTMQDTKALLQDEKCRKEDGV